MLTQCPYCSTLFRISTEQLKAAAGRAHCCRCDRVFSALDHLRDANQQAQGSVPPPLQGETPEHPNLELPFDEPAADTISTLETEFEQQPDIDTEAAFDGLLERLQIDSGPPKEVADEEEERAALAADDQRDPFEPLYDFSDVELDSVEIGLDSQLLEETQPSWPSSTHTQEAEPEDPAPAVPDEQTEPAIAAHIEQESDGDLDQALDPDTESNSQPEAQPASNPPGDPVPPWPIADDLPPLEPTHPEQETEAEPTSRHTLGWTLAILSLLLLALAQLAWFDREHLLRYPLGRTALESTCELLGCQLPVHRDAQKIAILSRSISSHPELENALLVKLTLRNEASFPQPYPNLELSLLDEQEEALARRSFPPEVYRPENHDAPLQPGIPLSIRLELEDPGEAVVGFRLEFY